MRLRRAVSAGLLLLGLAGPATAVPIVLFDETFDNASGFGISDQKFGIPTPPDADESGWHAARFQNGFGTPAQDVGIQEFGGGGNSTPVGIVEDDAGLVFEISTLGLSDVEFSFDWRTFLAEGGDRLRVGYLVAPSPFTGPNQEADFQTGTYAWSNWTMLLEGKNTTFQSELFALPSDEVNVLVTFWLDDGENDFGKIDNILVTAVPEPGTASLIGLGLVGLAALRRRR